MICCIAALAVMALVTSVLQAPARWFARGSGADRAEEMPPPARYVAEDSRTDPRTDPRADSEVVR